MARTVPNLNQFWLLCLESNTILTVCKSENHTKVPLDLRGNSTNQNTGFLSACGYSFSQGEREYYSPCHSGAETAWATVDRNAHKPRFLAELWGCHSRTLHNDTLNQEKDVNTTIWVCSTFSFFNPHSSLPIHSHLSHPHPDFF